MSDDYAHPVGRVADDLAKSAIDLMEQADAARQAGDHDKADKLDEEATHHSRVAHELDCADQSYPKSNK